VQLVAPVGPVAGGEGRRERAPQVDVPDVGEALRGEVAGEPGQHDVVAVDEVAQDEHVRLEHPLPVLRPLGHVALAPEAGLEPRPGQDPRPAHPAPPVGDRVVVAVEDDPRPLPKCSRASRETTPTRLAIAVRSLSPITPSATVAFSVGSVELTWFDERRELVAGDVVAPAGQQDGAGLPSGVPHALERARELLDLPGVVGHVLEVVPLVGDRLDLPALRLEEAEDVVEG